MPFELLWAENAWATRVSRGTFTPKSLRALEACRGQVTGPSGCWGTSSAPLMLVGAGSRILEGRRGQVTSP